MLVCNIWNGSAFNKYISKFIDLNDQFEIVCMLIPDISNALGVEWNRVLFFVRFRSGFFTCL